MEKSNEEKGSGLLKDEMKRIGKWAGVAMGHVGKRSARILGKKVIITRYPAGPTAGGLWGGNFKCNGRCKWSLGSRC